MREAICTVSGNGFASLRGQRNAGFAVDGSAIASQGDVAGAGIKDGPLLTGHGVGNSDGCVSGHIDPRICAA